MHSIATIATTSPSLQGRLADVLPSAIVPMRRAAPLTALRVLGNALLIVALLMLNKTGDLGAVAFFAILAAMVFVSPEASFKALAICYLGLMINTFFVPKSLVWTPGRIILPALALIRALSDLSACRLSLLNRAWYVSLLVFGAVMAFCSLVSGWYTQIALLKIGYFLSFVTLSFAATAVLRHRRADLGEWFVSLMLASAMFGVGAIAFNVDNNFRPLRIDAYNVVYGTMFNGAFSHPNVHAVYATLFVTFLAIVWLLSPYRRRWLVLPLLACWAAFIAWSASRTALVASFVGALLLVLYAKPLRTRFGWQLRPNFRRRTLVGIGVLAVVALLFFDAATGNSINKAISAYIVKGAVSDVDQQQRFSVERILTSRRGLIEFSWGNFLASPLTGIGFGVAKTESFRINASYLTAPSEKGFLPTAMLEEGGLIGTAAFLIFIGLLSRELIREHNVPGIIMFWVFIATNFGEVTMFSPGGAGAFGWIMIGASVILGDRCWTPPAGHARASPGVRGHS